MRTSSREKFKPGQIEVKLERAVAVWRRRCQGASMPSLAREFNISLSTVHAYIEEQRKLLRAQTIDLAAQERHQALELLDNAIEKVVPHINGEIEIETVTMRGDKPITISIEAWQARMQGCATLVKLLDRKAKLLGMDAPVKVEPSPTVPPESNEARARAREALSRLGANFLSIQPIFRYPVFPPDQNASNVVAWLRKA
jgi:hypothetical protein